MSDKVVVGAKVVRLLIRGSKFVAICLEFNWECKLSFFFERRITEVSFCEDHKIMLLILNTISPQLMTVVSVKIDSHEARIF